MNQLTIGKFIALKRKEKNLTQEQLAETLGVSNKTVSKWECGKCMPDYGIVKPLCQELGITVSELMDGEVKDDNSIRVFDEEQILDMLRRIQQLEKQKMSIFQNILLRPLQKMVRLRRRRKIWWDHMNCMISSYIICFGLGMSQVRFIELPDMLLEESMMM